jgi:hypothetical protein
MNSIRVAVLFAAASLSACSSSKGVSSEVIADLDAKLAHWEQHESAHAAAVLAATSTAAVLKQEDDHRADLGAEFAAARDTITSLSRCQVRINVPLETSGVHDALQDNLMESDRHDARIRLSPDLGVMKAEEQRHENATNTLVAAMRSARDDVVSRSSEADDCP